MPTGHTCPTPSPTQSARCRIACASSSNSLRRRPAASHRKRPRYGRCGRVARTRPAVDATTTAAAGALVDDAARALQQAGDVHLPDLRALPDGDVRARADSAGGGHGAAPSRAPGMRCACPAPDARRLAQDPAARAGPARADLAPRSLSDYVRAVRASVTRLVVLGAVLLPAFGATSAHAAYQCVGTQFRVFDNWNSFGALNGGKVPTFSTKGKAYCLQ